MENEEIKKLSSVKENMARASNPPMGWGKCSQCRGKGKYFNKAGGLRDSVKIEQCLRCNGYGIVKVDELLDEVEDIKEGNIPDINEGNIPEWVRSIIKAKEQCKGRSHAIIIFLAFTKLLGYITIADLIGLYFATFWIVELIWWIGVGILFYLMFE